MSGSFSILFLLINNKNILTWTKKYYQGISLLEIKNYLENELTLRSLNNFKVKRIQYKDEEFDTNCDPEHDRVFDSKIYLTINLDDSVKFFEYNFLNKIICPKFLCL